MGSFVRSTSSYKHKSFRRGWKRMMQQLSGFFTPRTLYWGGIFIACLCLIGGVYGLFVKNKRYVMQSVVLVQDTMVPYVSYTTGLAQSLAQKNYYLAKFIGSDTSLISKDPLLSGAVLSSSGGRYELRVSYKQPQLVLGFGGESYGIVDKELYLLKSGVMTGVDLVIPTYFTGMSLSGLFYKVSSTQLITQYRSIVRGLSGLSIQSVTYHPASHQIQINTDRQELYFDVLSNVFEQLKYYRSLSGSKAIEGYPRIIDLGASRESIVIYP